MIFQFYKDVSDQQVSDVIVPPAVRKTARRSSISKSFVMEPTGAVFHCLKTKMSKS